MRYRSWIVAFGSLVALCFTLAESRAWDETRYPDLKGQWRPIGDPTRFDPSNAWGRGQQAPLTPEYQALFEANLRDQAAGGQGLAQTNTCISQVCRGSRTATVRLRWSSRPAPPTLWSSISTTIVASILMGAVGLRK